MTHIIFSSYRARRTDFGSIQITLDIGKPDNVPMPQEVIEAANTAEALERFNDYCARAAATGTPMAVSARVKNGERKPRGFDAAFKSYYTPINL